MNPYGYGQPIPQSYMQPGTQMQPGPQMQQGQQVVRVNGENGARTYQIGANASALLLDESGAIVWLVTSDGAGYKTVAPYDITPHKAEPAPDFSDLEGRVKRLEEMMGRERRYGNSGNTAATGKKPAEPERGEN